MLTAGAQLESTAEHYADDVFAPVDHDRIMERIGGGFETEVYCTDDRRYLVKLKSERGGTLAEALERAQTMRAVADQIVDCLGPEHSIPSDYVLARDGAGRVQVLVVQPFLQHARPLAHVDYAALEPAEQRVITAQLRDILRRGRALYRAAGWMPDLYGLYSRSSIERKLLASPRLLAWHLWSFLFGRHLLRSVNLMLTEGPNPRVVLVDYDRVPWSRLVQRVYFGVRWLLSWRDGALLSRMERRRLR